MGRPRKDDKEKKSIVIKVRVNDEDMEHLNHIVEVLSLPKSAVIRMLIQEADNILNR